jgi:hypothetical protein
VVQAFTAQATSSSSLSEAATQQLLRMPAHPECLQPLLKQVLLGMLGDLEAVWADAALQEALLKLPLHVMELLLSLDELTASQQLAGQQLQCLSALGTNSGLPGVLATASFGSHLCSSDGGFLCAATRSRMLS